MDQQYLSGRQPRPPAERRTQARLRVQLPARGPDGQSWRVHDISRSGLCLLTDEPLQEGSALDLDLTDTASGRSCRDSVWSTRNARGESASLFVFTYRALDRRTAASMNRLIDSVAR